jgi:hypothetical protein
MICRFATVSHHGESFSVSRMKLPNVATPAFDLCREISQVSMLHSGISTSKKYFSRSVWSRTSLYSQRQSFFWYHTDCHRLQLQPGESEHVLSTAVTALPVHKTDCSAYAESDTHLRTYGCSV